MKAAIYCRVSTEDQQSEGTSLQSQLEACLKYCEGKGYEVAYRYTEAYSGLTLERPYLNTLRELIRGGRVEVVVIYCLDRLSRDPTHGVILTQELEKHGVKLEAVTEDIDNSELGKLISYIRGFASKLEAEKIRERTMRGKLAFLQEGKLPQGTGVGMYGYEWDKETKGRRINLGEARIVQEIFKRIAIGESPLAIARRLNQIGVRTKGTKDCQRKIWHSLTIRRMVRNEGYIGKTTFKNLSLPNVTPAIVTEDIFWAANSQLDKPKVRTGRPKHDYLLRNHAFCALCGKPLVGHCLNKKYRYYQCSAARLSEHGSQTCKALYIRSDDLERVVWDKTKAVLETPEIILSQLAQGGSTANLEAIEAEIKSLERSLRDCDRRRSNLLQAMELGEFDKDEILDRLNTVKRLRTEDEAKLNDLRRIKDNLKALANAKVQLGQLYDQVMEHLRDSTLEIKRLALDALDIKVYASTDAIEIKGVIPLELDLPTIAQTSA